MGDTAARVSCAADPFGHRLDRKRPGNGVDPGRID
jgi:hypothetical protein